MSLAVESVSKRGWVLLLTDTVRHYFIGKESLCGLFVPAISDGDYEERNYGRVKNCWNCEEALNLFPELRG